MTIRRLIVLLILITIVGSWFKFLYFPVITDEQGYHYRVRSGTSIGAVVDDLYTKNIITNRFYFKCLIRLRGNGEDLKAGEYLFPKGSSPSSILNQLVTGSGIIYQVFTIVPGWNFKELSEALLQDDNFIHTLGNLSDRDLMNQLGRPNVLPEGQFFPDTYYFLQGSDDIALLKRAFKAMQDKLKSAWRDRAVGLPYKNAYEALIAASLIEKEVYLKEERPIIAGVLVNRLRRDMLLQFDPTVIYGKGSTFNGKIRKEDLLENTPYNTYVHRGLPPSPISMPSMESLIAALHPVSHDYLYFVARGDGSHQFSKTLDEHHAAVMLLKKINNGFFNEELIKNAIRHAMDRTIGKSFS